METSPLEVTASSALMTFEQRMALFIVSHLLSHGNMGTERSRFLPKKYPFSVAYEMPWLGLAFVILNYTCITKRCPDWNKRPMGHIAHLRNQFKSMNTFARSNDYIHYKIGLVIQEEKIWNYVNVLLQVWSFNLRWAKNEEAIYYLASFTPQKTRTHHLLLFYLEDL